VRILIFFDSFDMGEQLGGETALRLLSFSVSSRRKDSGRYGAWHWTYNPATGKVGPATLLTVRSRMSQAEVAVKITVDLRSTVSFYRTRVCPKLHSSEPWTTNALEASQHALRTKVVQAALAYRHAALLTFFSFQRSPVHLAQVLSAYLLGVC